MEMGSGPTILDIIRGPSSRSTIATTYGAWPSNPDASRCWIVKVKTVPVPGCLHPLRPWGEAFDAD